MLDMLVKLYALPDLAPALARCAAAGVELRRGLAPEKHLVLAWIGEHFYPNWVSECDVAFARQPLSVFLALRADALIGFACYDSTARGLFGPMGVDATARGGGVGAGLLLACLYDMRAQGYAYGVIGGAGPQDFYARTCGATPIEGSAPGLYRGLLRED